MWVSSLNFPGVPVPLLHHATKSSVIKSFLKNTGEINLKHITLFKAP